MAQTVSITSFDSPNYLITPAPLAAGQTPSSDLYNQKFLLTVSGVAIVNVPVTAAETLVLVPDISTALQYAINNFGIRQPLRNPPGTVGFNHSFEVDQYTI